MGNAVHKVFFDVRLAFRPDVDHRNAQFFRRFKCQRQARWIRAGNFGRQNLHIKLFAEFFDFVLLAAPVIEFQMFAHALDCRNFKPVITDLFQVFHCFPQRIGFVQNRINAKLNHSRFPPFKSIESC